MRIELSILTYHNGVIMTIKEGMITFRFCKKQSNFAKYSIHINIKLLATYMLMI